jgi:TonB family protein
MKRVWAGIGWLGAVIGITLSSAAIAQTPTAGAAPTDAVLRAAEPLIGRALFLRRFYLTNDLHYDASGQVAGTPKPGVWTLAGMDIKKVERRGPGEIELDGVRVAIRYNSDNHQFERHPQTGETMKVVVADTGSAEEMTEALDAIFAQGIDPRLQQATPPYWQHYFNPGLSWPQDALTGQQIYAPNAPNQPNDVSSAVVAHKSDAKMTDAAERDKVHGTLQLRMVVDAEGIPQRIAIVRPLGYGLDEQAVEAVARWRFAPAMRQGQPVASAMLLNYDFEFMAPLH